MTFIKLRHGENEFLLLNTNCSNRIFMDFVRKQCKLDSKGIYDLIDETGVTADLYTKEANENVASFFTPRAMYILAAIELHEDNSIKKITPCLSEWEKKFPFLERKLKHRDKKQAKLGSDICSPDSPTSPKENSKLNRKRSERTSGTSRSDNQKENLSPTSGEHGGGSAKKVNGRNRKLSKR